MRILFPYSLLPTRKSRGNEEADAKQPGRSHSRLRALKGKQHANQKDNLQQYPQLRNVIGIIKDPDASTSTSQIKRFVVDHVQTLQSANILNPKP